MRLVLALAVFALAACSPPRSGEYPPDIEMNFMRACEAQSTVPGLCACTWEKIKTEVPVTDFQALELLPGPERLAHPLSQQINGYALACGAQLTQQPPGEPAGGQQR
jgi:hypothetical protein